MTYPQTFTRLTLSLAALSFAACTTPSAEDGGETTAETGGDGDGDVSACVEPGSELLPELKPALAPGPSDPVSFTCSSGWATDAPQREAAWTTQIGQANMDFSFAPIELAAHPDGGVVVVATSVIERWSANGDVLWSVDSGASQQSQSWVVVEDSGTIVVATYDWNSGDSIATRYDADGQLVAPLALPWNSSYANIWAIETYGADLLIGAFDDDDTGSYEATLLHLDPTDAVVLRKSTNQSGGQMLAVNDSGTVVFGQFPSFLLSIDNGAVIGTWSPSAGNAANMTGFGDDFAMVGNANGDLSLGRYSALGSERWLQTYDRATLGDQGRGLAVADDMVVAAGSTNLLNFANSYWFGSQPLVIAADGDGNALWTDRMAAHGEASGVAIGTAGEVYVSGVAELDGAPNEQSGLINWLRCYD